MCEEEEKKKRKTIHYSLLDGARVHIDDAHKTRTKDNSLNSLRRAKPTIYIRETERETESAVKPL
jgi:hypothetical protein